MSGVLRTQGDLAFGDARERTSVEVDRVVSPQIGNSLIALDNLVRARRPAGRSSTVRCSDVHRQPGRACQSAMVVFVVGIDDVFALFLPVRAKGLERYIRRRVGGHLFVRNGAGGVLSLLNGV